MSRAIEISPDIFRTDGKNYSQRVPCVLVLDCSGSMSMHPTDQNAESPIDSLNRALKRFESAVKQDDRARRGARIMLIRVGRLDEDDEDVKIISPFQDADAFIAPTEVASGLTPLGKAVLLALEKIESEKAHLAGEKLNYARPWLFVFSDGEPTDEGTDWPTACKAALIAEAKKKASIFVIAVNGGNVSELQKLSTRPVAEMDSAKFEEFFVWLSASIAGASAQAAENPSLPPRDWTTA